MRLKLTGILTALVLVMFLVSSAAAAFLLCVSDEELKGEETVGSCVAKGEQFAVVDEYGFVRLLKPEEIALTKVLNPKVFQSRAFGFLNRHLAPPLPPLPVSPEVPGG